MLFNELNIIEPIQKALAEEGYTETTPIQGKAIPPLLDGKDLIGCAQTGTGKTCAFAVPVLQKINQSLKKEGKKRHIKSVILAPTRELAIQIGESFDAYGRYLKIKSVVIFGGVSQNPQCRALKSGVDILVATPGRMLDLMNQGFIDLSKVESFVLDEADRMLDMGMIHDVKKIMKAMPKKKQSLLFSATMPKEISKLIKTMTNDPITVEVTPVSSTVDVIEQKLYHVDKKQKIHLLKHILKDKSIKALLVFTRTKRGANNVTKKLEAANIRTEAIHGNKSQNARQRALKNFKDGTTRVLVATDIAARGIDVDELAYVVNYDMPETPETYVHRIGRTGRAGKNGTAMSFCDVEEKNLLKSIEKLIDKKLEVVDHPCTKVVDNNSKKSGNSNSDKKKKPSKNHKNGSKKKYPNKEKTEEKKKYTNKENSQGKKKSNKNSNSNKKNHSNRSNDSTNNSSKKKKTERKKFKMQR